MGEVYDDPQTQGIFDEMHSSFHRLQRLDQGKQGLGLEPCQMTCTKDSQKGVCCKTGKQQGRLYALAQYIDHHPLIAQGLDAKGYVLAQYERMCGGPECSGESF